MEKISIIIPVYNAEGTVRQCVESIITQQCPALEILLIDDHSEDLSYQACCNLQNKYPCIRCMRSDGHGVSAARNTGLLAASGDIIGFCDADDTYANGVLQAVQTCFMQNKTVDVVAGGIRHIYKDAQGEGYPVKKGSKVLWSSRKLANHILYDKRIMGSVCNKFFRRKLLFGNTFCEALSHCEDTHFAMSVLCAHPNIHTMVLGILFYNYTANPDSATNQPGKLFTKANKLKYIEALEKIQTDCKLSLFQKLLIKRSFFVLSAETRRGFTALGAAQSKMLDKYINKYAPYAIALCWIDRKNTKSCLKWFVKQKLKFVIRRQ